MSTAIAKRVPGFGVVVPNHGPLAAPETMIAVAALADRLAFDSIWAIDHLLVPEERVSTFGATVYEQLAVLSHLAARTTRVRLGTTILVVPYRNPVITAKMLATLDVLSGGRLVVGAGSGWIEAEFRALGVDYDRRGEATDESLRIFRALWTGSPHGLAPRFENLRFSPLPLQRSGPPIVIGGNSRRAIRRAVELGDGWHPTTVLSEEEIAANVAHLRDRWRAGQRHGEPEVVLGVPVQITEHPRKGAQGLWGGVRISAGSPEQVAEELTRLSRHVNHFVLHVRAQSAAHLLDQVRTLAGQVIPRVRREIGTDRAETLAAEGMDR